MCVLLYAGSLEGDGIAVSLGFCRIMPSSSTIVLGNMSGK